MNYVVMIGPDVYGPFSNQQAASMWAQDALRNNPLGGMNPPVVELKTPTPFGQLRSQNW